MIEIQAGSRAFFSGMEGFAPHDNDVVVIENSAGNGYLFHRSIPNIAEQKDVYHVVKQNKERLMNWESKHSSPMVLGRYLLPAFCDEFGITVDDLSILRPMRDNLDRRHQYLGLIYDFYLQNGSMTLTEQQRQEAFEEYKKERKPL